MTILRATAFRVARTCGAARPLSTSMRTLAAGDTGALRPGGQKASDTFSRREAANEELYIRNEERRRLQLLKEKLKKQREHLDELEKHIDDLTKDQGGEQN